MNYIKKPNLPQKSVKKLIISSDCSPDIVRELKRCGIDIIFTRENAYIEPKITKHADISILHIEENRFLCAPNLINYYENHLITSEITGTTNLLMSPYPNDAALNIAFVGDYAIFNPKTICEQAFCLIEQTTKRQIHVNQGYTKCNVVPVSSDAIITEDVGIFQKVKKHMDVLLVKCGAVKLDGYAYGFIGGACGKIAKDMLAFTGSLKYFQEYEDIFAFCRNHNVSVLELSNYRPFDLGSILPVAEE